MAKLSDIAKVLIELRTSSVAKANFGIPIVIGDGITFGSADELVRVYQSADDAVKDTTATIPEDVIDALRAVFSQKPRLQQAYVGRLVSHTTGQVTLTAPSGGKYAAGAKVGFTLDGTAIEVTAVTDTLDTPALVSAELVRLLGTSAANARYTFAVNQAANGVDITPTTSINVPVLSAGTNTTVATSTNRTGDLKTQLANLQGYNNSWYGFSIVNASTQDILDASEWAEAADPVVQHWATSDDDAIWLTPGNSSATDVLTQLKLKQYERTALIPTKNTNQLDAFAAMARFYAGEPGSIVAGLKTLTGITPTLFTPSELKNIKDKNGNYYTQYASNVFLFNPGVAVSGRWLDEVRDRDWLVNYIETEMVSALMRRPKVPYTAPGITIIENVLRGCLVRAQQMGVVAPDQVDALGNTVPGFVITVPNIFDVPFSDKAARVLKLSFVALLAGAIQSVEINGVLTYDYSEA